MIQKDSTWDSSRLTAFLVCIIVAHKFAFENLQPTPHLDS